MDTIEAIHGRCSIRAYRERSVEADLIDEILWDAAQAPTPPVSGSEPFSFVVIEGAERVSELGMRALRYAKDNRKPGPAYNWVDTPGFRVFFNAPIVIVICGFDDGLGQAIQDCNRAGQNLMLSAHARGLGTCWVGSPMLWIRGPATIAELAIPDGYLPLAVFTLGYAAEAPAGKPRQRPNIIRSAVLS